MRENELSEQVIGAAIEVHRVLGPGLLEVAYEEALCHELGLRGIPFERQILLPIQYKDVRLSADLRIDILVGQQLILELKSVELIAPIHKAQLLTYLRLSNCRLGLLINFNERLLKDGISRVANGMPS
jgi:GxxExxY protein